MDSYLDPFFKLRISKSMSKIEQLNKTVLTTLNPHKKSKDIRATLNEEEDIIGCDKCE